jgi:pre-rRNA-processing protein TSR2
MSSENPFHSAVEAVFQNWTALQFAISQGAAGPQSADIAKWMVSATVQWFSENKNLEFDEVEDFLLDIVNQEFDVLIDDGSVTETSKLVCDFYRLCSREDCEAELKSRLQTLPKCDLSKCKVIEGAESLENVESNSNNADTTTTNDNVGKDEKPKPEEQDPDDESTGEPPKKKKK